MLLEWECEKNSTLCYFYLKRYHLKTFSLEKWNNLGVPRYLRIMWIRAMVSGHQHGFIHQIGLFLNYEYGFPNSVMPWTFYSFKSFMLFDKFSLIQCFSPFFMSKHKHRKWLSLYTYWVEGFNFPCPSLSNIHNPVWVIIYSWEVLIYLVSVMVTEKKHREFYYWNPVSIRMKTVAILHIHYKVFLDSAGCIHLIKILLWNIPC